jgi:hypothetical protein
MLLILLKIKALLTGIHFRQVMLFTFNCNWLPFYRPYSFAPPGFPGFAPYSVIYEENYTLMV